MRLSIDMTSSNVKNKRVNGHANGGERARNHNVQVISHFMGRALLVYMMIIKLSLNPRPRAYYLFIYL